MDVAIRAVSWLWDSLFRIPTLSDGFLLIFYQSLYAHAQHIWHNLEWSAALTTNHYLSNLVGLVYLGILLPEFRQAQGGESSPWPGGNRYSSRSIQMVEF
jgi:hypothetical protein